MSCTRRGRCGRLSSDVIAIELCWPGVSVWPHCTFCLPQNPITLKLVSQVRPEPNSKSQASLDRLFLDAGRVAAIARGVEEIALLPDPVGRVLARFQPKNGLTIERVSTPLGVIGVIYESRPNVTADAGALSSRASALFTSERSELFSWSSVLGTTVLGPRSGARLRESSSRGRPRPRP